MNHRATRARAGVFIIGAAALLALVLVVFGGMKFWEQKETYRIEITDTVMGLEKGAYVYLDGIRVGQVADVTWGEDDLRKVVVTIKVKEGTPIHTDTIALLQHAGITGLKVIDLRGGERTTPRLAEGGTIKQGKSTLDQLEERAKNLAEQSTQLLERANEIVANVATITDPAQFEGVAEIVRSTKTITANLARSTSSLDAIIGENRTALKGLVGGAGSFMTRLQQMVSSNEGPLRSAVYDLRQASRNFKELSRDVRQRPSRLLYSSPAGDRKLP
jgi:phospholipid/cholesterol/gamma-HCH transport system substrate-binding protein